MKEKCVATGIAYYWSPHDRDLARGCSVGPEPLGRDYAAAIARANFLNVQLDAWRHGSSAQMVPEARPHYGTVRWLCDAYQKGPVFLKRVSQRSRYEYRRALKRIEDVPTSTGGTVGQLPVAAITPAAVDKIYSKLQDGPRGKRRRQANLSIDIARRAWKVMRRSHPSIVPLENPWAGVERDLRKATKIAATREEAYSLAFTLTQLGEPHLGAAALICFEWHQRPEHVLAGDITWQDYRPTERPDAVFVRHPKTGEKGWLPLGSRLNQVHQVMIAAIATAEWKFRASLS